MEWVEPNIIILQRVLESPHPAMVRAMAAEINAMIAQGDAPIHLIADSTPLQNRPVDFNAVHTYLKLIITPNADRLGWLVLVSHNSIIETVLKVMRPWFGLRLQTVRSVEDARQFLISQDERLTLSV